MRALIVGDALARGGLAAVRSLASAGWTVGVATPGPGPLTWTRYADDRHRVPPPASSSRFVSEVAQAVAVGGYEVIFPTGDAEMFLLSRHRDEIGAVVPFGSHESVEASLDKVGLAELAASVGLGSPSTRTTELDAGPFPAIVKPRVHKPMEGARIEASIVTDAAEARTAVARVEAQGHSAVVQDLVEGTLMALAVVVDREGQVVAGVQQEADRLWPSGAGISARAHTVPVDRALLSSVERLLKGIGWCGLAEVQFMVPPDGDPKVIDINGRLYGSVALAIAAGVDLPAIWADAATGRSPRAAIARSGVRYQWLEGDLRAAATSDRRIAAMLEAVVHSFSSHHSILSASDPFPAIRMVAHLLSRAVKKVRR